LGLTRAIHQCDEKTNTGEVGKDKRERITSDDVGGKSVSEKSKFGGGQRVGENSEGGKSGVIRSSVNIFEVSRRDHTPHPHPHTTYSLNDY
jgi:hypothetical protein